jgi:hypothetical protein
MTSNEASQVTSSDLDYHVPLIRTTLVAFESSRQMLNIKE